MIVNVWHESVVVQLIDNMIVMNTIMFKKSTLQVGGKTLITWPCDEYLTFQ